MTLITYIVSVKSTLYTLNTHPEVQIALFRSVVARFPDI